MKHRLYRDHVGDLAVAYDSPGPWLVSDFFHAGIQGWSTSAQSLLEAIDEVLSGRADHVERVFDEYAVTIGGAIARSESFDFDQSVAVPTGDLRAITADWLEHSR